MAGNSAEGFIKGPLAKGEKKKRKRPSKKVPTTVLESSSTNFMNLVQKLTGSADEPGVHDASPTLKSTTPSPYSSPSHQTTHHEEPHSQSFYPQHAPDDSSASSHAFSYHAAPYSPPSFALPYGYDSYPNVDSESRVRSDDHDDVYSGRYDPTGYPSSSRAMEHDMSPFSWREPLNHDSTSNYW